MTGSGDISDDIEWLDEDRTAAPSDEELAAGSSRPPLPRRTRIALGVVAAAVLGVAIVVAVGRDSSDHPRAAPTSVTAPPSTPVASLPAKPSSSTLAALRSAFPGAVLTGYVAVRSTGPTGDVFRIYNLTSGRRQINVTLRPAHDYDKDGVYRAYSSLEIAQSLGSIFVQATVRVTKGQPTAADFAGLQQLVQDARLLVKK